MLASRRQVCTHRSLLEFIRARATSPPLPLAKIFHGANLMAKYVHDHYTN